MLSFLRAARAALSAAPSPAIAAPPPVTDADGFAPAMSRDALRRAARKLAASQVADPPKTPSKKRRGRPATKQRAQPVCPVCRGRHPTLDPLAVRALAAAGFGKARAARAMGLTVYRLAKVLSENEAIATQWQYGQLDRWRRDPNLQAARPSIH